MDGRRARRKYRHHLPIVNSSSRPGSRRSWYYCELKMFGLNDSLYWFGRKHAKFLRLWFSLGTGFGITALLFSALTLILLCLTFNAPAANHNFHHLLPLFSSFSLSDTAYILVSTLVSVALHEFGHAVAAASEGIQIEYIAVYLAVIFPGALVAFNYESLQTLSQFATLRIYCAGIWHNAVCCAACMLVLFLLPLILHPFYMNGDNPMVLDVQSTSPLSSYLSPGDIIESVDGLKIRDPQEWMEMMRAKNEGPLQNFQHSNDSEIFQTVTGMKGYCIPNAWMEDEQKIQAEDDYSSCPDELTTFSSVPCVNMNGVNEGSSKDDHSNTKKGRQCFNARDIVELKKCGTGWLGNETSGSNCVCLQEHACLAPVLVPGQNWVEITYRRPYSSECLLPGRNSSLILENPGATNCIGTFVFIGDTLSIENLVQLTAYQPRWKLKLALDLPARLEKLLVCTFRVSLALTLLNSLPVFLLDGESILEVIVGCTPFLTSRRKTLVLQICLMGGTLLSILAFTRGFLNFLY